MGKHPAGVGRERILEVAEELFTQQGYRAVSIRDIARDCQMTSAALYYHFPSKHDLFMAVMERHAENLNARMRAAGDRAGSFIERVTALLWEYSQVAADRRSPVFLLRREKQLLGNEENHDLHARLMHAMLRPLEELIAQAVETGEIQALPRGHSPAALMVGMLHGQALYRQVCQSEPLSWEDIELVARIFWQGVSKDIGESQA